MSFDSNVSIEMQRVDSKEALFAACGDFTERCYWLGCGDSCLIGFYLFRILKNGNIHSCVGVCTYILAIKPVCLLFSGKLLVGYNMSIAIIAMEGVNDCIELPLLSLFWEFWIGADRESFCVICETALVGVSVSGREKWRWDTELLVDYKIRGDLIDLYFDDKTAWCVNMLSGDLISKRDSHSKM